MDVNYFLYLGKHYKNNIIFIIKYCMVNEIIILLHYKYFVSNKVFNFIVLRVIYYFIALRILNVY
jgi:hypothetical protein